MSDYTVRALEQVPDAFGGQYPGSMRFLTEEILNVGGGSAVRVSPSVVRSVWNDGPDDAELVICSVRLDDARADGEIVEDFWPD